jgi:hypothetical protein
LCNASLFEKIFAISEFYAILRLSGPNKISIYWLLAERRPWWDRLANALARTQPLSVSANKDLGAIPSGSTNLTRIVGMIKRKQLKLRIGVRDYLVFFTVDVEGATAVLEDIECLWRLGKDKRELIKNPENFLDEAGINLMDSL